MLVVGPIRADLVRFVDESGHVGDHVLERRLPIGVGRGVVEHAGDVVALASDGVEAGEAEIALLAFERVALSTSGIASVTV